MIFVNSIATAVFSMLSADPVLVSSAFNIDLNQVFNTDPNRTPWVGIYADNIDLIPMRIGTKAAKPWDASVFVQLFVQAIGFGDPADINDELYRAMTPVLDVVNSDYTLRGTVRNISGIEIAPFQRDATEEDTTFTNIITLTAEVRA